MHLDLMLGDGLLRLMLRLRITLRGNELRSLNFSFRNSLPSKLPINQREQPCRWLEFSFQPTPPTTALSLLLPA